MLSHFEMSDIKMTIDDKGELQRSGGAIPFFGLYRLTFADL